MKVNGNFMESEYQEFSLFVPSDIHLTKHMIAFVHDKHFDSWYVGQIVEINDKTTKTESYELDGEYTGNFITKDCSFFVRIDTIKELEFAPEFDSITDYC